MNKLNVHTSMALETSAEPDVSLGWFHPQRSNRLIVLIPVNLDCTTITRRVWELAQATDSTVQLLGLCRDASQEPALRRELVTISALIQDARVSVETRVDIGTNWLDTVKHTYQDGDMLVCVAEQTTGIRHRPLSQILESNLQAPVYILAGLQSQPEASSGHSQLLVWPGFLGIMVGFLVLQVKVVQFSNDWLQTLLLVLLLIPEFWLLWIWNSLLG